MLHSHIPCFVHVQYVDMEKSHEVEGVMEWGGKQEIVSRIGMVIHGTI